VSDTGDVKQVNKKKTKMELRRLQEMERLKDILSKEGGRDFIWRLLTECGNYNTTFTGEPYGTVLNEGRRQIGLWVLTEIFEADPQAYIHMQSEKDNK